MIFFNQNDILVEKEVRIDDNEKPNYRLNTEDEETENEENDDVENNDETESQDNNNNEDDGTGEIETDDTVNEEDDNTNEPEPGKYSLPNDMDEEDETETQDDTDNEENDNNGEETQDDNEENGDNGEETQDNTDETQNDTDNEENVQLSDIEKQIFSNMTPEQIALQDKTLRSNYNDMYNEVVDIINRLKDMEKPSNNFKAFSFIERKLNEVKELIYDYMNNTYYNSTYIENNKQYQMFISILLNINLLFDRLNIEKDNE